MTMVEAHRKHRHRQAIRSVVFATALAWLALSNGVVLTSQPLDGAPMEYHPVGGQSFRLQSDAGKPWLDAAFDMDGTRVTFNWPKDQWTGATVMTALIRKERTDPELVLLVRNGVDEIGASDSKVKDTEYSMPIRGSGGFSTVRFNVPTPGNKTTLAQGRTQGKARGVPRSNRKGSRRNQTARKPRGRRPRCALDEGRRQARASLSCLRR